MEPSEWLALRGEPAAPRSAVTVHAGALTAELAGTDLRYVSVGGVEIVRRLHGAVRDVAWGTVPGRVHDEELAAREDGFAAAYTSHHRSGDIDFAWRATITGTADGRIAFALDGRAQTSFAFNRIGLCVLHPLAGMTGQSYEAVGENGLLAGRLPSAVAAQRIDADGHRVPVVPPFRALAIALPDGGRLRFAFSGDLFELEDQRNWADGSLKSYSTPLHFGLPRRVAAGQRIAQRVELWVEPAAGGPPIRAGMQQAMQGSPVTAAASDPSRALVRRGRTPIVVVIGEPLGRSLPPLGLTLAGDAVDDSSLRALQLAHLRVEVRCDDAAAAVAALDQAAECALTVGCRLEVALHAGSDADTLAAVAGRLVTLRVARVLVFAAAARSGDARETTPPALAGAVRAAAPGLVVGGGSHLDFCALTRTPPDPEALAVVAFPVMPQVHGTDEATIRESLEALGDVVATARSLAGGRPVTVTPLVLEPGAPDASAAPGARQASAFAAAWALGAVAQLAVAGASSLTLFATSGTHGVVRDGRPTPAYALLRALAGWTGAQLLDTGRAPADRHVAVLALACGDEVRLLAANPGSEPIALRLGIRGEAATRTLRLGPYATEVVDLTRRPAAL